MKKIRFSLLSLGLITLMFVASSCKKDQNGIVGTWNYSSHSYTVEANTAQAKMLAEGILNATTGTGSYTFNSDGTCSVTASGTTETGTYTYEGSTLTINFLTGTLTSQCTISGKTMSIVTDATTSNTVAYLEMVIPDAIITKVTLTYNLTK